MSDGRSKNLRKFGSPCKKCGIPLTESNILYKDGRIRSWCRDCMKIYLQEWKKKNPTVELGYDLKQYGISAAEYNRRLELQLNGCAICKQPCKTGQRLSVDHNHATSIVRDLLCKRCNMIIGLCEEDDGLLFDIVEYLKRHAVRKAG
jgi:hypothetical protein